jgi:hypothetical protein
MDFSHSISLFLAVKLQESMNFLWLLSCRLTIGFEEKCSGHASHLGFVMFWMNSFVGKPLQLETFRVQSHRFLSTFLQSVEAFSHHLLESIISLVHTARNRESLEDDIHQRREE